MSCILDLFCGMGNFSLPLAKMGADVIGVEGLPRWWLRHGVNAKANNLDKLTFIRRLWARVYPLSLGWAKLINYCSIRAGRLKAAMAEKIKPRKVVYVSCNPARAWLAIADAVKRGYRLQQLGLIDMFPQTHHIEAMALFELTVICAGKIKSKAFE